MLLPSLKPAERMEPTKRSTKKANAPAFLRYYPVIIRCASSSLCRSAIFFHSALMQSPLSLLPRVMLLSLDLLYNDNNTKKKKEWVVNEVWALLSSFLSSCPLRRTQRGKRFPSSYSREGQKHKDGNATHKEGVASLSFSLSLSVFFFSLSSQRKSEQKSKRTHAHIKEEDAINASDYEDADDIERSRAFPCCNLIHWTNLKEEGEPFFFSGQAGNIEKIAFQCVFREHSVKP